MENNNIKEVKKDDVVTEKENDAVLINKDGLDVKKGGNIIIGTLNVFAKPLKKRHEKHYKESNFHLMADIVFVLIILLLGLGVYRLINFEPKIAVLLQTSLVEEKSTNASDTSFEISFKNETEKKLDEVFLSMDFPKDFILKNVYPNSDYNSTTNTLGLGSLESGANGSIKVEGILMGNLGDKQKISSIMTFKDGEKERRTMSSLTFSIEDSLLEFEGDFPDEVYFGSNFSGVLKVKNSSNTVFENMTIIAVNDSYEIISLSSNGELKQEDKQLILADLKPQEEREIQLVLELENQEVNSDLSFDVYGEVDKKKFLLNSFSKNIKTKEPKLDISAKTKNDIIALGEETEYEVSIKNTEESVLKNISLSFFSTNKNFVFEDYRVINEPSSFDKNNFKIETLEVGESKTIVLSGRYKKINEAKNQMTGLLVQADYYIESSQVRKKQQSEMRKANSELTINSNVFYFSKEGDQYGAGPLPPVVGLPTSYYVMWELKNNGNDLSDFSLRAKLGSNVVYGEIKSLLSGDISFDEKNKEIIWEINSVTGVGSVNRASFQISIIPEENDIDSKPVLLLEQRFEAKDEFTGQIYQKRLKSLDTSLENDKYAQNKGMVTKSN